MMGLNMKLANRKRVEELEKVCKPEIAHAQKYFAIQTRRQELTDASIADLEPNKPLKTSKLSLRQVAKLRTNRKTIGKGLVFQN